MNSRAGFSKISMSRIGNDLGRRLACTMRSPPSRFLMALVAMVVRGHRALTAMPFGPQLAGKPENAQAHAVLRQRIGHMRREPFLVHVEGRRQHEDVRIGGPSPDAEWRISTP